MVLDKAENGQEVSEEKTGSGDPLRGSPLPSAVETVEANGRLWTSGLCQQWKV